MPWKQSNFVTRMVLSNSESIIFAVIVSMALNTQWLKMLNIFRVLKSFAKCPFNSPLAFIYKAIASTKRAYLRVPIMSLEPTMKRTLRNIVSFPRRVLVPSLCDDHFFNVFFCLINSPLTATILCGYSIKRSVKELSTSLAKPRENCLRTFCIFIGTNRVSYVHRLSVA